MTNKNNSLVRVPRVLSEFYNSDLISKMYETVGSICVDLIIFCIGKQQKNLFGETWFSLQDFCNSMGYERTTLQRKLTPAQLYAALGQNKAELVITGPNQMQVQHSIETLFEVALYKCGKENIAFPTSMNGKTVYNFVQIATSLEIQDDITTRKKTKRLYSLKFNNKIEDTFFNSYNILDLQDYRSLPDKAGYRYFYLNLSRMIYLIKYKISKGESPYFILTVDQLAQIFDIHIKENRDRKKKVNEVLKRINDKLNVTKFEYSFIVGKGQTRAYTIQFLFSQQTLDYFDENFKAVFTSRFYKGIVEYYLSHVVKTNWRGNPQEFDRIYRELRNNPETDNQFIEWVYSDVDKKIKEMVYRETFKAVYNKTPEDMGFDPNNIIF